MRYSLAAREIHSGGKCILSGEFQKLSLLRWALHEDIVWLGLRRSYVNSLWSFLSLKREKQWAMKRFQGLWGAQRGEVGVRCGWRRRQGHSTKDAQCQVAEPELHSEGDGKSSRETKVKQGFPFPTVRSHFLFHGGPKISHSSAPMRAQWAGGSADPPPLLSQPQDTWCPGWGMPALWVELWYRGLGLEIETSGAYGNHILKHHPFQQLRQVFWASFLVLIQFTISGHGTYFTILGFKWSL